MKGEDGDLGSRKKSCLTGRTGSSTARLAIKPKGWRNSSLRPDQTSFFDRNRGLVALRLKGESSRKWFVYDGVDEI